jgi:hypothetical protein
MARVFAITTTATSLRLDAQGLAETSFTVSNASGHALRGRAEVRATDSKQQGWLSVVGDAERDFPSNGTHQIAVRLAAPAGSPAGTFSFRLDMVSSKNPDEDFAEGPTVTFEVPAPAPKKPFPWWIVAVAAAVVLIVGGLATYLMMREPAPKQAKADPATLAKKLAVQYSPGWVNYSDLHRDDPRTYTGATVWKVGEVCVIEGLAQSWGQLGIVGQPQIATLPQECRPKQRLIFNVNNHTNTARLDMFPDGKITWGAGGTDFGWLSLSGVVFATGSASALELGPTWVTYDGNFAGGAVRKQGRICIVEGLVRTTSPGVAAQPQIATLPQDCRPMGRVIFNLNNHARTSRIDALVDGKVDFVAGGADYQWMSLSGLTLATGEGQPLELAATWVNYASGYAPAVVRIDGGLCAVEGLVKTQDPGGIMARPKIATLPPGCRPKEQLVFNLNNHARTIRVDVLPNGDVQWFAGGGIEGGGSNEWISLNGIILVPEGSGEGDGR